MHAGRDHPIPRRKPPQDDAVADGSFHRHLLQAKPMTQTQGVSPV